jgi:cytochrome P450
VSIATDLMDSAVYADYCRGTLSDPYPLLDELRATDPVHWSDDLDAWLVTRYDDVLAGLTNPVLGNERIAAYMTALSPDARVKYADLAHHIGNFLGFTDPPKHTRLRKSVSGTFTPRLAEAMRPRISTLVDEIANRAAEHSEIDVVADYAFPLPAQVIYQLLGVAAERGPRFKELTDDIVPFTGGFGAALELSAGRAHDAVSELGQFFDGLAVERAAQPGDDVLTQLAIRRAEGTMTDQELASMAVFIFLAGYETTVSLIATGIWLMLSHPDARAAVTAQPDLLATAVEEILRFESPIQLSPRVATASMILRGRQIKAGQTVILANGAANRDPDEFPEAARFDVRRSPNRHLAFGWAAHFCLGAPLARIEAQTAIGIFLARFPDARLTTMTPAWAANVGMRIPARLPVRLS